MEAGRDGMKSRLSGDSGSGYDPQMPAREKTELAVSGNDVQRLCPECYPGAAESCRSSLALTCNWRRGKRWCNGSPNFPSGRGSPGPSRQKAGYDARVNDPVSRGAGRRKWSPLSGWQF